MLIHTHKYRTANKTLLPLHIFVSWNPETPLRNTVLEKLVYISEMLDTNTQFIWGTNSPPREARQWLNVLTVMAPVANGLNRLGAVFCNSSDIMHACGGGQTEVWTLKRKQTSESLQSQNLCTYSWTEYIKACANSVTELMDRQQRTAKYSHREVGICRLKETPLVLNSICYCGQSKNSTNNEGNIFKLDASKSRFLYFLQTKIYFFYHSEGRLDI